MKFNLSLLNAQNKICYKYDDTTIKLLCHSFTSHSFIAPILEQLSLLLLIGITKKSKSTTTKDAKTISFNTKFSRKNAFRYLTVKLQ